jgi:group I intron endonuclease
MQSNIYYIYKITNKFNNKVYIGYTGGSIQRRWKQHISCSKIFPNKTKLYSAINKYGPENFSIETIYCSLSKDHTLKEMEPYFIRLYNSKNSGYNIRPGGEGAPGTPSKEHRKKLSDANKGKIRSEESKKQQSISIKEHIQNNGGSWKKGIPISENQKEKQRKSMLGTKHSKESNMRRSKIYNIISPLGEIFNILGLKSLLQFCKEQKIPGRKLYETNHTNGWSLK